MVAVATGPSLFFYITSSLHGPSIRIEITSLETLPRTRAGAGAADGKLAMTVRSSSQVFRMDFDVLALGVEAAITRFSAPRATAVSAAGALGRQFGEWQLVPQTPTDSIHFFSQSHGSSDPGLFVGERTTPGVDAWLGLRMEDSTVNVLFSAVQVEEAATCGYGALLVLVDKPTSVAADEQVV